MIVSHRHQFIFVHIHKTAGEAFSETFAPYLGPEDFEIGLDHSKVSDVLNGVRLHKHSPAEQIKKAVGDQVWERYYSFATIRRPEDRALSLYKYIRFKFDEQQRISWWRKLKQSFGMTPNPMSWPAMQAFAASANFSEFIRHRKFLSDNGAQPQIASLTDSSGDIIVDRICRFENLTADFSEVATHLGFQEAVLKKVNQSAPGEMRSDLCDDDIAYLLELYAQDNKAFGYA